MLIVLGGSDFIPMFVRIGGKMQILEFLTEPNVIKITCFWYLFIYLDF